MDPEQIKEIIETIKTLNLNIDSETAVKIVNDLKPILWFIVIKDFIMDIFVGIIIMAGIYLVARAVFKYYQNKK